MKQILSICLISCVLWLVACSRGEFKGYVVEKEHRAPEMYTTIDVATQMTTAHYTPEQWLVYVADSNEVRVFNVRKKVFDSVNKGDFVTPISDGYATE